LCLGIPARVMGIEGWMAEVEVGGVVRRASIQLLEHVEVGDYVLLHAGFAIQVIDEEEAEKTLKLLGALYEIR